MRRSTGVVIALVTMLCLAAAGWAWVQQDPAPYPSPSLTPEQVVRIQLDALRDNDRPTPNAGITVAYRFASPGNRAFTGPLPRFARLVNSPEYRVLLNHRSAYMGRIDLEGTRAHTRVALVGGDGEAAAFRWELSQQTAGPCTGCWMTDGVVRESVQLVLAD